MKGRLVVTLFCFWLYDGFSCFTASAQKPEFLLPSGNAAFVSQVALSPEWRTLAPVSRNVLAAQAAQDQNRVQLVPQLAMDWVFSVAFSPNGRLVLTGSLDGRARLWDAASGKQIRSFEGHAGEVTSVAFSPDGHFVLTGNDVKRALLWDAASGKQIRSFEGHAGEVDSVAFSSDGRYVLTGSSDNTARLWDRSSGQELRSFEGHTSDVWSVAFSPDCQFVLTGSKDKTARLWDMATGKQIRSFEGH